jgi:hypothetical protein
MITISPDTSPKHQPGDRPSLWVFIEKPYIIIYMIEDGGGGPRCLDNLMGGISSESFGFFLVDDYSFTPDALTLKPAGVCNVGVNTEYEPQT